MNQIMVKGSVEEKNDLINLALEFLKSRNEELKISQDSWSLIRGKDFEGNLNEIQQLFMASNSKSLLKTENPKSLLTQLDQKEEIVEKEKDDFKLQTCPESRKRLVQEVHNSGKKTEFEENLKRKYTKENGRSNVKLFEADKSQLSAISSKKLIPKKPLFGRAFCPKSQEVRLKFLLNGVEDIKDVFFYLPEEVSILIHN